MGKKGNIVKKVQQPKLEKLAFPQQSLSNDF